MMIFLAMLACARLSSGAEKVKISSFSTILTEIAERVGGDRVEVTGHVKPGVDPHEFEPKPADLATVSTARLVLLSARHMEGYVSKLREATGGKAIFLEVGEGFGALKIADERNPGKFVDDPHWWHSVENVLKATRSVRDALVALSPAEQGYFSANADAYVAELSGLEKWIKGKLAELPRDRRKLVTSHDAFQYFAKENGFTVYAVEGISSSDQPSSKKVADLIRTVKEQGVKAIFAESIENPRVLDQITRETGAKLGANLFADGLGEGDAGTFAGMMKHNVSAIVDALK